MDQSDQIKDKVYKMISKILGMARDSFEDETPIEDLAADSLELFTLLIAFEKEFNRQASYEDLLELHTVGDIIKLIQRKT